jgi:hypothetical protein
LDEGPWWLAGRDEMATRFVLLPVLALYLVACSQSSPQSSASTDKAAVASNAAAPPKAADSQPASTQAAPQSLAAEKSTEAQQSAAAQASPGVAKLPEASRSSASDAAPVAESPKPAASAPPPAPPKPQFREVTIPAGTSLNVKLSTAIASDTSKVEDEIRGTLTAPIVVAGTTAVPAGSEIIGTVRDAKRSGRVKGRATIAFAFERLIVRHEPHTIRTSTVTREAAANRSDDVKKGAIGGAAGAIVGGIVGGGKGAAIGAGVGGTGAVVATRGDEVRLPSGTTVRTTLRNQLKVVVPLSNDRD